MKNPPEKIQNRKILVPKRFKLRLVAAIAVFRRGKMYPKTKYDSSKIGRMRIGLESTFVLVLSIAFLFSGLFFKKSCGVIPPDFVPNDSQDYFCLYGPNFLKELAFAGIIAAFVGLVIERRSRAEQEKLVEEALRTQEKNNSLQTEGLKRGMFREIFKRRYDESYVTVIEQILTRVFFYRGYSIHLTIEDCDTPKNSPTLVKISVSVSTYVYNISEKSDKYPFRYEIERPSFAGETHPSALDRLEFHFPKPGLEDEADERDKVIEGEKDIKELEDQENTSDDFKKFKYDLEIKSSENMRFDLKSTIYKTRNDEFNWRIGVPSDSLTVSVFCKSNLNIKGIPIVPYKSEDLKSLGNGAYQMSVVRPTLPANGILIWWTDNDESDEDFMSDEMKSNVSFSEKA